MGSWTSFGQQSCHQAPVRHVAAIVRPNRGDSLPWRARRRGLQPARNRGL